MPPQFINISLYDAALVNVAPSKTKESPKKVMVKVTRKKQTSGGVKGFSFVKDGKGLTSSQPENKQKDIAFHRGGFIKPLTLLGGSKKKLDGRKKRTRL